MFGADFALRWPPEVFVDEVAELVRLGGGVSDWEERVAFALEEAFAQTGHPRHLPELQRCPWRIE